MAKKAKKSDDSDKDKKSKSSKKSSESKAKKPKKSKTKSKSESKSKSKSESKSESTSKSSSAKKSSKKTSSKAVTSHETVYALRNHPDRKFSIKATLDKGSKGGEAGASITGEIREGEGDPFTYVVQFEGEFTSTKADFDEEMYLLTAVSVMQSQIESHKHRGTLLKVHRDSGLIHTEPLKQAAS